MSKRRPITFIAGISILYGALIFVGLALSGAGHGSDYFGAALLAPFSAFGDSLWVLLAGLALWVSVPVLIAMRRYFWCRLAAAAALISHYLGVLIMSSQREDWGYVALVWRHAWGEIVLLAAAYFSTQGFMWSLITRRQHGA